jgi:hypothetical protein
MRRHTIMSRLWVVAVALGLAACGQDSGPLAPTGQGTAVNPATVTINGVQLLKAPAGLRLSSSVTKEIDEDGGTLTVDGAWLTVPAGALDDDEDISMANASDLWAFDFGPDGLTFDSSATLTVKITISQLVEIGVDPYDLKIAYATNGMSNDWQILGGSYDPNAEEISLPIDHFSRYSLCVE